MLERLKKYAVILPPFAWLLLFFLIPFWVVFQVSLADPRLAQPPFTQVFDWSGWWPGFNGDFENYQFLLSDSLYINSYLNSLKIAFFSSLICLIVGYPIAYVIARSGPSLRNTLLLLVILPFWTSSLLRIYALIGMYSTNGFINTTLQSIGLISEPLQLMNSDFAVYSAIVITYLPLMILPLYSNLEKLDESLLEASSDLGAGPLRTFGHVTLPLSLPGIIAGCILVFVPSLGAFLAPDLLGGAKNFMIGSLIEEQFKGNAGNWPFGAAASMILLSMVLVVLLIYARSQRRGAA